MLELIPTIVVAVFAGVEIYHQRRQVKAAEEPVAFWKKHAESYRDLLRSAQEREERWAKVAEELRTELDHANRNNNH